MKRDELFIPGQYASLPNRVMARADLSAAAKLIYQAIASHLRNGEEWVWPSLDRLAEMTSCGRRTIIRSIEQLRRLALIETEQQPGISTRYKLLSAEKSPVPKCHQCQNVTQPVPKCHGTRAKMSP